MSKEKEDLFLSWLNRHQGLIQRIIFSWAIEDHDRSDLFQDICLQLWRSVEKYRGQCAESTWIYRVSFNTAMAFQRKVSRHRSRETSGLDLDLLSQEGTSVNSQVLKMRGAMKELSPLDRALILMQLEGLTYREIAEVSGLTESNVGVKLNRIRARLKNLMEGDDHA